MYVGMICHRDVLPWLVAVKSVSAMVGDGEFCVINDGSLTAADCALLSFHLVGLKILALNEIENNGLPRGNCWERLLAILAFSRDRYILQVDADLVARSPLPEVVEAVQANRSFTLAGEPMARLKTLIDASEQARHANSDHVQWLAERQLNELPDGDAFRYVRGCAGFAGFPKGSGFAEVAALSQFMQSRLGSRWHEWGSEQVASNFVVANASNPMVLPWRRYPAFGQVQDITESALVHFVGTNRYDNGVFTQTSQAAVRRLSEKMP